MCAILHMFRYLLARSLGNNPFKACLSFMLEHILNVFLFLFAACISMSTTVKLLCMCICAVTMTTFSLSSFFQHIPCIYVIGSQNSFFRSRSAETSHCGFQLQFYQQLNSFRAINKYNSLSLACSIRCDS